MNINDQPETTVTVQQATERVKQYARELKGALPVDAVLEERTVSQGNCEDPSGGGFGKRVQAWADYWVRGLDPAQYNAYFDAMKSWLSSHGWRVGADRRPGDMFLNAVHEGDEFTMSLAANDKGGLALATSSPCVWPDGTPEPES
ncbi:hypothetical protein SAMN05421810_107144 [Amycolatopsis arida]|uniref:Lipoprotein n=1 Tax=Amycolatopsis arida TaxID=587909 RepID=A0A1I5YGH7_9PSEU|nr:hypothetical protein [Amycolatopsis arida]TDX90498.1 hypothetical protein CLV69_107144 [Amycolatopsis arida]SFQ43329.1 hypothetical protein SAMN05421810_107144 [Amycolatopsis arida]